MDSEQIEQQMRATRALIDAKLDLLARRTEAARRRALPAVVAVACTLVATIGWMYWRTRRKVAATDAPRLLKAV